MMGVNFTDTLGIQSDAHFVLSCPVFLAKQNTEVEFCLACESRLLFRLLFHLPQKECVRVKQIVRKGVCSRRQSFARKPEFSGFLLEHGKHHRIMGH